jgi:Uma2 family endonuclease
MTTTRLYTAEDLEALGSDAPYVLIDGRLVYEEMGSGRRASRLALRLGARLAAVVDAGKLGEVYGADGTFVLRRGPDTVLVPDGAFVRADRLPPGDDRGFLRVAPDIAIEVLSPSNRPAEIARKVGLYLAAGSSFVWIVDADARTVTVYAPDRGPRTLTENDTLDGGDVLPGFALPLAELFAP